MVMGQTSSNGSMKNVRLNNYYDTVIILLNGAGVLQTELGGVDVSNIGIVLSDYLKKKGQSKPSIIEQYFDVEKLSGKTPVYFVFTQDKVKTITTTEFLQELDGSDKLLFKIDNESIIEDIGSLESFNLDEIDKIQMINDFTLTKWDTGEKDVFTLFVITTKR